MKISLIGESMTQCHLNSLRDSFGSKEKLKKTISALLQHSVPGLWLHIDEYEHDNWAVKAINAVIVRAPDSLRNFIGDIFQTVNTGEGGDQYISCSSVKYMHLPQA